MNRGGDYSRRLWNNREFRNNWSLRNYRECMYTGVYYTRMGFGHTSISFQSYKQNIKQWACFVKQNSDHETHPGAYKK